jgi:hypothetical protein
VKASDRIVSAKQKESLRKTLERKNPAVSPLDSAPSGLP